MTKKARVLLLSLSLTVQLTSFGWPPIEASQPALAPAGREYRSQRRNTTRTRRRRSSRRRSSYRRRLTRRLQKKARAAIAKDDMRGEDMEVRRAALKALGSHAGTVVVMDPRTGRVYSIVNQAWAVRKAFIPCSTIKPFTALAGLKEKLIRPTFALNRGQSILSLSLIDALSHSDNLYFQRIGVNLGLSKIRRYAAEFGLGQRTGINLPGEVSGRLPDSRSVKQKGIRYTTSHGEGFKVTPLQLAVFTAALANRGSVYQPQVVIHETHNQSAGYGEGGGEPDSDPSPAPFLPLLRRRIDITEVERINIIAGMSGAVEFGTARTSYDPAIRVAGKTGTCTGDNRLRVGLFTSFATIDRPALVVVVITNGLGESGSTASRVAGKIYQQLADRFHLRSTAPQTSGPEHQASGAR